MGQDTRIGQTIEAAPVDTLEQKLVEHKLEMYPMGRPLLENTITDLVVETLEVRH